MKQPTNTKGTHKDIWQFYIGMIGLAICMMVMIIGTSYNIYLYSQLPKPISGKLDKIDWGYGSSLEVYVNGNRYFVDKPKYSNRTFGILGNTKLGKLKTTLEGKIGSECHLEYVPKAQIVDFTINGFDFIDKETAINDFIESEKMLRHIGIGIIVLILVCLILLRKEIIK